MLASGLAQSRDHGAAQSGGRRCAAVEHATQPAEIAGVSPYLTGIGVSRVPSVTSARQAE